MGKSSVYLDYLQTNIFRKLLGAVANRLCPHQVVMSVARNVVEIKWVKVAVVAIKGRSELPGLSTITPESPKFGQVLLSRAVAAVRDLSRHIRMKNTNFNELSWR